MISRRNTKGNSLRRRVKQKLKPRLIHSPYVYILFENNGFTSFLDNFSSYRSHSYPFRSLVFVPLRIVYNLSLLNWLKQRERESRLKKREESREKRVHRLMLSVSPSLSVDLKKEEIFAEYNRNG